MSVPRLLRGIDFREDELKRVAIETPAWMHRQRRRLVQHDDRVVFVDETDLAANGGLRGDGKGLHVALPCPHHSCRRRSNSARREQASGLAPLPPFFLRDLWEDFTQRPEQRRAVAAQWDVDWTPILIRNAAGQW